MKKLRQGLLTPVPVSKAWSPNDNTRLPPSPHSETAHHASQDESPWHSWSVLCYSAHAVSSILLDNHRNAEDKNGKCINPSKKEYSVFTAFTLVAAVKGGKSI